MEIFALVMASLWGFLGIFMLRRSYKRKTLGVAAIGVVVGHRERRHSGASDTSYSSEVEFEAQNGQKITFAASFSSKRLAPLGSKVKVLYYPDNPQDADISAPLTSWIAPLLLLAFGSFFLFMAVVILFTKGA